MDEGGLGSEDAKVQILGYLLQRRDHLILVEKGVISISLERFKRSDNWIAAEFDWTGRRVWNQDVIYSFIDDDIETRSVGAFHSIYMMNRSDKVVFLHFWWSEVDRDPKVRVRFNVDGLYHEDL